MNSRPEVLEVKSLSKPGSSNADRHVRNAFIISLAMTLTALLSTALFGYYGWLNDIRQFRVFAGLTALSSLVNLSSLILSRRGKSNLGIMLLITASLSVILVAPFLIEGIGILLLAAAIVISTASATLAMPPRFTFWGIVVGLLAGTTTFLLDINLKIGNRIQAPGFMLYIVGAVGIVFAIIVIQEYRRFSLRTKIALGILITGGISVSVVAYYSLDRSGAIIETLTNRYETSIQVQVEAQLSDITKTQADQADHLFAITQNHLVSLADYRAQLENQSPLLGQGLYWDSHEQLFLLPDGQYGNSFTEPASVFVPSTVPLDEALLAELNTSAYLDFSAPDILKNEPEIVAVYYISELGATTYYPNINLALEVPADFDPTAQPFYTIAAPQNNPERLPRWTEPYQDPAGTGLIVTAAAPVYNANGVFKGVAGMDLQLARISENISAIKIGSTGFAFLVDDTGHILAMPPQGYTLFGLTREEVPVNETPKQAVTGQGPQNLQAVTNRILSGESGLARIDINGVNTYIAFSPLVTPGYNLGLIVPVSEVNTAVAITRQDIQNIVASSVQAATLIMLALLVGAILSSLGVGQVIALPLKHLAETVGRITAGDLSAQAVVESQDETGTLAEAFNIMTARLRDTLFGLELRVAERTEALRNANEKNTHRAAQFEAIARVARTISSTQDLNSLLPQITQVISQQFGFYHAGIFLNDTREEYAVLVAANSEGGKRMLARRHRLKVGETGIVGYVTASGKPRLALNTGADAVFFENPDLPNTHSEIALPLRISDRVIGALDVQSTETNAFSQEDVNILSTLADQVSVAIQNARYYEQTKQALAQAQAASRQLSRQAWKTFVETDPLLGYQFDGVNAQPVHRSTDRPDNSGLAVPLRLRGQTIGTLRLSSIDPHREWSDDEIAMAQAAAERTAIALEGARLLQEAQKRAAKERTIGDISAKIGNLVDIDNILQTAIQELSRNMPDAEVAIQFQSTGKQTS